MTSPLVSSVRKLNSENSCGKSWPWPPGVASTVPFAGTGFLGSMGNFSLSWTKGAEQLELPLLQEGRGQGQVNVVGSLCTYHT